MEGTRLAAEGDLPACRELVRNALAGARDMRGGATLAGAATEDELLDRWTAATPTSSSDHAGVLMVGEFQQVVVGVSAATARPRPGTGQLAGLIECLFVEPDARGVGVGSALMSASVEWCRDQGCVEVDALALPGDRSSKQRFEGAGFSARLLTLSRRLD